MTHRCRLCTANDQDAVIEHVAEQLWESCRSGSLDDRPWPEAGGYWQTIMRRQAATAVASLRHDIAPDGIVSGPRSVNVGLGRG